MKLFASALLGMMALVLVSVTQAAQNWVEGTHYSLLKQPQHTEVARGKVEVMEVFSYGCPACNQFQPLMHKLESSLPKNAQMVFLPAAFHPEEDWTVFQRAYFTAQMLGVAQRTHQEIFDAVWETGELGIIDSDTHRLKNPLPSIEDAAKCYERLAGIKAAQFLATAHSFSVDVKMQAADAQIIAMQVPGTPCLIVNGKYMVNLDAMHSQDDVIAVVRYLIERESQAPGKAS